MFHTSVDLTCEGADVVMDSEANGKTFWIDIDITFRNHGCLMGHGCPVVDEVGFAGPHAGVSIEFESPRLADRLIQAIQDAKDKFIQAASPGDDADTQGDPALA